MGVVFKMTVVTVESDGSLRQLQGPDALFRGNASAIHEFVQAIETHRSSWGKNDPDFVWYNGAQDGAVDGPFERCCFDPMRVLKSLEAIERELAKHRRRYGAGWVYSVATRAGESARLREGIVLYRGARCRLFADNSGVWAREIDPGPREGIHHELSRQPQAVVQREDGEELIITPRRYSLYEEHAPALAALKKVCLRAMQDHAMVLTEIHP